MEMAARTTASKTLIENARKKPDRSKITAQGTECISPSGIN